MHRLERIVVRGFRGQARPIELDLQADANFIIGRNGTGKTTLINLIHAALSIDLPALRDGAFDRIEFIFKRPKHRVKPRVVVMKAVNEDGYSNIIYRVANSATAEMDEYVFARQRKRPGSGVVLAAAIDHVKSSQTPLRERLLAIFHTTWLSLQRGADKLPTENDWEEDGRPDVDRKLSRLSNDLTKYFSRLDRLVSDQTQLFQKEWFLSFLASDRRIRERDIGGLNEADEREALSSIFGDFNMQPSEYTAQLDRHFRLSNKAKASFKADSSGVPVKDYLVAVDVMRLHSLVEQWQVLEDKKEEIYRPKQQFEMVATEMLFKKKLYTNRSNEIVIESDDASAVGISDLSSGEKQLLIFLSETLLQEQKPYIFLADEPELSMHVEWQEELVPALLKINPNAQVLFATHSPDIVNKYQENVHKMEELVS